MRFVYIPKYRVTIYKQFELFFNVLHILGKQTHVAMTLNKDIE